MIACLEVGKLVTVECGLFRSIVSSSISTPRALEASYHVPLTPLPDSTPGCIEEL